MDLFEYMAEQKKKDEAPLASRMRPETLDEVVGQEHIIGKDKLLYRAIKADKLSSLIFYGPPGTGKTTLARVIANTTSADFEQVNATIAGKKTSRRSSRRRSRTQAAMAGRRSFLSMRFTASTSPSRIISFPTSRTAHSFSLVLRQKTHILR